MENILKNLVEGSVASEEAWNIYCRLPLSGYPGLVRLKRLTGLVLDWSPFPDNVARAYLHLGDYVYLDWVDGNIPWASTVYEYCNNRVVDLTPAVGLDAEREGEFEVLS